MGRLYDSVVAREDSSGPLPLPADASMSKVADVERIVSQLKRPTTKTSEATRPLVQQLFVATEVAEGRETVMQYGGVPTLVEMLGNDDDEKHLLILARCKIDGEEPRVACVCSFAPCKKCVLPSHARNAEMSHFNLGTVTGSHDPSSVHRCFSTVVRACMRACMRWMTAQPRAPRRVRAARDARVRKVPGRWRRRNGGP